LNFVEFYDPLYNLKRQGDAAQGGGRGSFPIFRQKTNEEIYDVLAIASGACGVRPIGSEDLGS
jgi:hypothetical protein